VVWDYQTTGLTLRRHPLALLRPQLDKLGLADTGHLQRARAGTSLVLPGLVLMRQRPGSAKGRAALVAGRLLVAEGRVEREAEHAEVPIVHLIVRRLTDRSDLLDGLLRDGMPAEERSDAAWAERSLGHADEVRQPEPGSRRPRSRLPGSRDFR
jgi:error-prone DNA polymerase